MLTRRTFARLFTIAVAVLLAAAPLAAVASGAAEEGEPVQDADAVLAELLATETLGPRREEAEAELALVVAAVEGEVPLRVALGTAEKELVESAADGRTDTKNKPILIVHGRDNYDMGGYTNMRNYLIGTYGFTGGVHRVGFYGGECNVEERAEHHGSHSTHYGGSGEHVSKTGCVGGNSQVHDLYTDIRHLSYHLAWMIHDHWTVNGVVVDYHGHSMGGLLIRYALAKQGVEGFPAHILVEDVTTLGTPHKGSGWGCWSPWSDGQQMCPSNSYMTWLQNNAQNPQSKQWSTDWTLVGSDCDGVVGWDSATGMQAAHKVVYMSPCYGHSDYYGDVSNVDDADVDWQDAPDTNWYTWLNAPHAVKWTAHATYVGSW